MAKLLNDVPGKPRLVLRVGFAGNQDLPVNTDPLEKSLSAVLAALARRIAEIAPGTPLKSPVPGARESWVRDFYSADVPLMRLVTGLCDGADLLAGRVLQNLFASAPELEGNLATELAAVIPFSFEEYRKSQSAVCAEFDRQAESCVYVLPVDGVYRKKSSPPVELDDTRRARAYIAQAALLLRHVDVLVAVANTGKDARPGGTLNTMRAALDLQVPVVFIDTAKGAVRLIDPGENRALAWLGLGKVQENWEGRLRDWVSVIVAGPDVLPGPGAREMIAEIFETQTIPPVTETAVQGKSQSVRRETLRERIWAFVDAAFRPGFRPKSDPEIANYSAWRRRI